MFNILDNAADASLANQQPQLDIQLQLSAGKFQMQIRDFGVGLTAEQLKELGLAPQPGHLRTGFGAVSGKRFY